MNINEQISRIKQVMGLNEETSLNEIGFGAYAATQQAGKNPVQIKISPESKTIADKLHNSVGHEEFINDLKLIKNTNQFWEVDAAIRQFRADRPDYGFEKLVNGGGNNSKTTLGPIVEYLKSIGIQTKDLGPLAMSIEILSKPTVVKTKPKMNWVKETGKFPLMYGQVGPTIKTLQIALGLKGDTYFGPTTEKYILSKAPEYKRATGVTQDIYNKIVNASKPATQTTTTPPTETQLQANPSTLNPY